MHDVQNQIEYRLGHHFFFENFRQMLVSVEKKQRKMKRTIVTITQLIVNLQQDKHKFKLIIKSNLQP